MGLKIIELKDGIALISALHFEQTEKCLLLCVLSTSTRCIFEHLCDV